jgi:lipase chaperone LimK
MKFRRSTTAALCVIATACAIMFFWQRTDDGVTPYTAHTKAVTTRTFEPANTITVDSQHSARSEKPQSAFSASLRGTQRDGQLHVDENGELIIERGVRDLFDYYLTTLGEHDLDAIRQQLLALFERELPATAALQATQLLDAYLQYRERSGGLQQQYPALNDSNVATVVADYFAQRDALRHQLFEPDVVEAFFSADKTDEQEALPKLRQFASKAAPANTAGDTENRDSYSQYRTAMHTAKAADRDTLRMQLFGREATDRLAALDQHRSDWSTRVANYREQKQQLLTASAQAGIDPSTQLQQLQQSQFSEREILRVRTLDKFEQLAQ